MAELAVAAAVAGWLGMALPVSAAESGPRLVFACSAQNDLYRVLAANGNDYPRFASPGEAVERAATGAGVLILADAYPQRTTPLSRALFDAAAARHLRLYVEFPSALPEIRLGAVRRTELERAVVASEVFGPTLPRFRLLAIHDCQ